MPCDWVLLGPATANQNGKLVLSDVGQDMASSAAWYPSKIKLAGDRGFEMRMTLRMAHGSLCTNPRVTKDSKRINSVLDQTKSAGTIRPHHVGDPIAVDTV